MYAERLLYMDRQVSMRGYSLTERSDACRARLRRTQLAQISGTVTNLLGLVVEVEGLTGLAAVGDRLALRARHQRIIPAEVIGFRNAALQAMAYGSLDGLAHGAKALLQGTPPAMLDVASSWLGRVIDPLGNPLDQGGILFGGPIPKPTRAAPPEATARARLGPRIDLGVRALNCFATCRQGQRLGLFAGSGVGKSTLLSMLTRGTECDVVVLALVGERGREVREFIETDLGPDGLARSVVVVATSDSPPLMRRQCAYTAMTVAEHFRDQGLSVLLLMDSVTRFCLALREIGLSLGEPPATRGYPPSVFAELPRLLERAGPGPVRPDGSAGHRWRTRSAASSTDISRWIARSPRPDAIRRSMSCARSHGSPRRAWTRCRRRRSGAPAPSCRCTATWRTWCASAPTGQEPTRRWTRRCA
jgi:flagellum-specific ATP synthase